jgi:ribosome-associated protein
LVRRSLITWQPGKALLQTKLNPTKHEPTLANSNVLLEQRMNTIDILKEPVELYKILKFEGMTSTGGEAKLLIGDGQVTVNGETETRRRRKMVNGDVIGFRGDQFHLQLATKLEGA